MGQDPEELDATDEEAYGHREPGYGQVVVNLADRVEEGPTVSKVHEQPVGGVHEGHPGGEQNGRHRTAYQGM